MTTTYKLPEVPTHIRKPDFGFMAGLWFRGSHSHGTYIPPEDEKGIDDIDLMGCVIAPKEHYLGLDNWGSRGTREVKEGQWDVVYYELKKFVGLLLNGNPNVMMALWMPQRYMVKDSLAWHLLTKNRDVFRGKHVYHAFAGYAQAQLEKMTALKREDLEQYLSVVNELKRRGAHTNPEPPALDVILPDHANRTTEYLQNVATDLNKKFGGNLGYLGDKRKRLILKNGYDTKNAAHLLRLLGMAYEFLTTGQMVVDRSDAGDADFLIDVKKGVYSLETVQHIAKLLFADCRTAYDESALPEQPDREAAGRLVAYILEEELFGTAVPVLEGK